jgi:hypothetical protein
MTKINYSIERIVTYLVKICYKMTYNLSQMLSIFATNYKIKNGLQNKIL